MSFENPKNKTEEMVQITFESLEKKSKEEVLALSDSYLENENKFKTEGNERMAKKYGELHKNAVEELRKREKQQAAVDKIKNQFGI
jgi:RNA polymerase-interacting CarD/CdnL/TRCF family regulator